MKKTYCLLAATAVAIGAQASDFFNTGRPESLFDLGVQIGVNTSNRTVNKEIFNLWNNNAWGTGFELGVTADINIRDYISLQPGFFFESRSGSYAYAFDYINEALEQKELSQFGKVRSYNFTIPLMASLHFNVTDDLRWNVEVGPYFQIVLKNAKGSGFMYDSEMNITTTDPTVTPVRAEGDNTVAGEGNGNAATSTKFVSAHADNFDFGFKFGTSLTLKRHYSIGVHYMAGCLDVWKESALGGRNKAWVFTVGYTF